MPQHPECSPPPARFRLPPVWICLRRVVAALERHTADPQVAEHGCATLARLATHIEAQCGGVGRVGGMRQF